MMFYSTPYHSSGWSYFCFSRKPRFPRPIPRWLRQTWSLWVWLLLLYFDAPEWDAGTRRGEAMQAKSRASGREPETKPAEEEVNNENI